MTEGGRPAWASYSHGGESRPEPPSAFGISPRTAGGEGIQSAPAERGQRGSGLFRGFLDDAGGGEGADLGGAGADLFVLLEAVGQERD